MQNCAQECKLCNQITKELSRLQQMASNNKLSSEDITGGTITLSNIGAIGGKFGSPLLNLPEVAIIAIGRIQKLPRFDDDEILYPASVTNVSCYFRSIMTLWYVFMYVPLLVYGTSSCAGA